MTSTKKNELVNTINNIQLYENDIRILNTDQWLTDKVNQSSQHTIDLDIVCCFSLQIVDSYLYLIMQDANQQRENSVYCVTCFFYTMLTRRGFKEVTNWIKVLTQ